MRIRILFTSIKCKNSLFCQSVDCPFISLRRRMNGRLCISGLPCSVVCIRADADKHSNCKFPYTYRSQIDTSELFLVII